MTPSTTSRLSPSGRPYIELTDGSRDFRHPTDIVVIVAYYGLDLAGAEYLMCDGSFACRRDGAAEFVRPTAEAKLAEIQPTMGARRLHLWVVRSKRDDQQ